MSILIRGQIRRTNRIGLALGVCAGVFIFLLSQCAHAAPVVVCNHLGCSDRPVAVAGKQTRVRDAHGNGGSIIGHRPRGCPHKFCGCEASLYVFGEIRPMLNVARNWRVMFARAHPAPGRAAVRTHHVMILISHVSGNDWLVHDGNSGGGLTREHVRSIAGYTIVDPGRSRMASAE